MRNKEIAFLTLPEVLEIHLVQMKTFGGVDGVRDMGLLESAIAQPEITFGGVYLHESLFQMAAAYAFHLASNHPFHDGNKRAGLGAAVVFLGLNGYVLLDPKSNLIAAMLKVASGTMKKEELSQIFRKLARKK